VFESVCSLCHDAPAAVMGKQWTKARWEAKVAEMLQEETDVTTEERAAIVEYLSANFKPGGTIYVNKATARDLEAALELTARDAEAIARHREEHGNFKTVDDLKNVAGLGADDLARIEARKARLAF
jgi:competence protein ComEA